MIETQEFTLSKPEFRRLLRHVILQRRGALLVILWLLLALSIFSEASSLSRGLPVQVLVGWAVLVLALTAFTLWLTVLLPIGLSRSRRHRSGLLPRQIGLSAEGMDIRIADGTRSLMPCTAVERTEVWDGYLMLHLETGALVAVPDRAFPDPAGRQAALTLAESCARAGSTADDERDDIADPRIGFLAGLKRNLRAGLRLLLFRRVAGSDFAVHADQVLALGLATVVVAVLADYLALPGEPQFSEYGLFSLGMAFLLLLGGAYLAVRATGQADRLLPLLVMLWSLEPWLVLPYAASDAVTTRMGYEAAESWVLMGLLLWVILAWIRVMGLAFAADRFRAAALAAFLCVVAVLPQWLLPYNELWYVYDADRDAPEVAVNVEDVFYAQHALVAEAVDSLAGDRPGVVDLYHVGFGSYAPQAVFRREVEHVRAILDERFDTAGRSLALINFADTVGRVPIASRSNLELALQGVAARMNTEEDVLLLYLTSHGSPNGKLSVSFWPLQLNDVTAQDLRRMLDDSGIRWRVIVVSACYSGTFIDALQDEGTLVITASARDRNSFGCSNENEYTYFGEAFFRDALAETRSFAAGFERAKAIVTRREKEEGRKPSEPKLVSGEAIAAKLAVLEARLSSAAAAD